MIIRGGNINGVRISGLDPLYTFSNFTFTNGNSVGRTGPTTTTLRSLYDTTANTWINNDSYFTTANGIQIWTVPVTGTYTIVAKGAQGGPVQANCGGVGAVMQGDFYLVRGDKIKILVGQTATVNPARLYRDSPGGGGTFVVKNKTGAATVADVLVIAGGGGGTGSAFLAAANASIGTSGQTAVGGTYNGLGGTNGAGGGQSTGATANGAGGGLLTDGASNGGGGGQAFNNGGLGGTVNATYAPTGGGFGGGGAPNNGDLNRMAGGGGYSGGGASDAVGSAAGSTVGGGGGGSYNAGTNQINLGNASGNFGNGSVAITFISAAL